MNDGHLVSFSVSEDFSRWFFMPPFVAIVTVGVVAAFSGGTSVPVDPAIWGLAGLMFITLTVLYGSFIWRGFYKGLLPAQLVAQGLLLCPLSLRMGARMLQWLGVTMTICGSVVLLVFYCRHHASPRAGREGGAPLTELDALPVPFAITDGAGSILSVSDSLLQMTQQTRETSEGKSISQLLPIDQETVTLNGKPWKIVQFPLRDGRFYFQLEDVPTVIVSSQPAEEFVDPNTMLHSRAYAIRRLSEELSRIRRYKRWMSAALLRAVFRGTSDPAQEERIFNAYCHYVHGATRGTDIACTIGPKEILVLMPETQLDQARVAVSKLTDFAPYIEGELIGLDGAVELQDGVLFLGTASGDFSFEQILEQLNEDLEKK
jgi:hypothetical protein